MAKGRLLLVVAVLATFAASSVATVSAGVVAPVKGPAPVLLVKKAHKKIHKRRRHHHKHHKKTVNTVFHPVKV